MAIGVDIEALEGAAERVDGIAGNFRADLDSLGKLVQETGNYMQGGPQASFEAKYAEFQQSLTNFIGALNTFRSYGVTLKGVDVLDDGMDLKELEKAF